MRWIGKWLPLIRFQGSTAYWRDRYRLGGDSGAGSGGAAAIYKSTVLNSFVHKHGVRDVVEFGCGDGRQLEISRYPSYLGIDVSPNAVEQCRRHFVADSTKRFALLDDYSGEAADLSLSLDVLFHLVEDKIYFGYLDRLFNAGKRFVLVYSTSCNNAGRTLRHVRHRPVELDIEKCFPHFSRMTEEEAELPEPVERGEGGYTRFFIYRRRPY